jgi:hypothetical protein
VPTPQHPGWLCPLGCETLVSSHTFE